MRFCCVIGPLKEITTVTNWVDTTTNGYATGIKFKSHKIPHYMYLHVNVLTNQINKLLTIYILIINVGKQ